MTHARTVQYKIFRGAFATWDKLFAQAAAFATALGEERILSISHSANLSDSVVAVWYWDNPAPPNG